MRRFLSYPLEDVIPVYGGKASLAIKRVRSISRGDAANVAGFTIRNHWGTHIDAPAHFFQGAKKVSDYGADFWFFTHPQVVEFELQPAQILERGEWINTIDAQTDLLLFKAGWAARRNQEQYSTHNPGISPEVGTLLRRSFPLIRAVGIDWVSISSYQNRSLGRAAHRAFLDPQAEGEPILIVEDMDLSWGAGSLKEVQVVPLRVKDIDSSPCTVIGEFGSPSANETKHRAPGDGSKKKVSHD